MHHNGVIFQLHVEDRDVIVRINRGNVHDRQGLGSLPLRSRERLLTGVCMTDRSLLALRSGSSETALHISVSAA